MQENRIIAKFEDELLYENDIKDVVPKNTSSKDSTQIISQYIDLWLKKQLLVKEAAASISKTNKEEVNKKTREYKDALVIYDFQKELIKEKLDTLISTDEIREFYNNHSKDFELKQNIVKAYLVKVSNKAQSLRKFKRDFYQNLSDIYVTAYCKEFPERCLSMDGKWQSFDDIINGTPYEDLPNKTDWLTKNNRFLMMDEKYSYFIIITDYKLQNKVSPLDFVKDQIKSIVLNRRKLDLINNYEEDLYKKAISEKRIERY